MQDKNTRRWLWLALSLALVVGLACEGEDNRGEGKVNPENKVTVQITGNGHKRDGGPTPYSVKLTVRNLETGQVQILTKELIGRQHTYNIDYNRGTQIEINYKVFGGANDVFDCKIYDGPDNIDSDHGLAQVTCGPLTTAR